MFDGTDDRDWNALYDDLVATVKNETLFQVHLQTRRRILIDAESRAYDCGVKRACEDLQQEIDGYAERQLEERLYAEWQARQATPA